MKSKSFFLLLIFLLSLIPFESVHASNELSRTLENSVSLMYVSDAILLNDIVDDETSSISKVSSRTLTGYLPDETTDLINQMINATKAQRNDHDRKCRETIEIFRQQGKTCEVDQTNAYCKSKRAELTAKIAALRKARGGDKRKWFTKQWHGLKRAGAKFWHRIGPLGRKFLREVGPQALKIVAAGGPGTEALMKNLIKHTAKNMARQRFKQIGFQALQRILKVQIEVATAAGVDICAEEKETKSSDDEELSHNNQVSDDPANDITLNFSTNEVLIEMHDLFQPHNEFDTCGKRFTFFEFDPTPFPIKIEPAQSRVHGYFSMSFEAVDDFSEWTYTEIYKDFTIDINSPFTLEPIVEGQVWQLNATGTMTLHIWGKTRCHYWEVPNTGDPILKAYWVEDDQTVQQDFPFWIRISTTDNTDAKVSMNIANNFGGEFDWLTIDTSFIDLPFSIFEPIVYSFSD